MKKIFKNLFIITITALGVQKSYATDQIQHATATETRIFYDTPLSDVLVPYNTLNEDISTVIGKFSDEDCIDFELDTTFRHGFTVGTHHQSALMLPSYETDDPADHGNQLMWMTHSANPKGELMSFELMAEQRNVEKDIVLPNQTAALEMAIKIEDEHPSGMAYYPFSKHKIMEGLIFYASENLNKLIALEYLEYDDYEIIAKHSIDYETSDFNGNKITDVWVARDGETTYLVAWSMNTGAGKIYHAPTRYLSRIPHFEKATNMDNPYITAYLNSTNMGTSSAYNPLALLQEIGTVNTSITDSAIFLLCNKYLGQNAQLVKDSTGKWYILHSYSTGGWFPCGTNFGSAEINAHEVTLSKTAGMDIKSQRTSRVRLLSGSSYSPGGDGASGFFVNKHGVLNIILGAQYAHTSWGDYKTAMAQCVPSSDD